MFVCCECCVLSGRGLCGELINRPEESYRLWCVVVCDLETSWMRRPWPTLGPQRHRKENVWWIIEKILPPFSAPLWFIVVFIRSSFWFLFWVSWIETIPSHPSSLRSSSYSASLTSSPLSVPVRHGALHCCFNNHSNHIISLHCSLNIHTLFLRSILILSFYLCLGLKDCRQIIFTALHLGTFMSTLKIILRNLFGPDGLCLYNPTQTRNNPVNFQYPCFVSL